MNKSFAEDEFIDKFMFYHTDQQLNICIACDMMFAQNCAKQFTDASHTNISNDILNIVKLVSRSCLFPECQEAWIIGQANLIEKLKILSSNMTIRDSSSL